MLTPMLPPTRIIVFTSSRSWANSIYNSKKDIMRISGACSVTTEPNQHNKVHHERLNRNKSLHVTKTRVQVDVTS